MPQEKRVNIIPGTKTIEEILATWKASRFTGIAIFNVALGIPHSVEYGRPQRVEIEHSELLEHSRLTEPKPSP